MNHFKRKIRDPLLSFLKQGTAPKELAWTVSIGVVIGLMPVLGASTVLCALIALRFRFNMAAIQLINYFVYPLQLLLFVPFFRLGECIFYGHASFSFSMTEIAEMVKESWWHTIQLFWLSNLMGVLAWLLLSVPFSLLLYHLVLPAFKRMAARNGSPEYPDLPSGKS